MTNTQDLKTQLIELPLHTREQLREILDDSIAKEYQRLAIDEEQAHLAICRERIAKSNGKVLLPFADVMKSVFEKP